MESLTLKKLQEKCASLNLKQYGTKATMIKRINEHEAKLREKEIDLASQLETALTNNDESNLDLQLEKEESEDEGELIDILKSNPESPDKLKEKEWGINYTTKQAIDKLFRSGTKSGGKILSVLRIYQQETIKDRDNKTINNPDFIQGIELPSTRQIVNYVNNTLKPKVVATKFSFSELAQWIENHLAIPEDENEAFVLDAIITINDVIPKGLYLFIYFFTISLLLLSYLYI